MLILCPKYFMVELKSIGADRPRSQIVMQTQPSLGKLENAILPSQPWFDNGKIKRLLFDLSYTLSSEKMSGVERVVTNLQKHLAAICEDEAIEFVPVISVDGRFYPATSSIVESFQRFVNWKKSPWEAIPFFFLLLANGACRLIPQRKVIRALKPEKGHLGIFRLPAEIWERLLRRKASRISKQITASKDDLVLMPDAYWTEMQALRAASRAKMSGARVVAVAYDLIPLTHPEFVGQGRSDDFRQYYRELLKSVSGVLAISQSVACDFRNGVEDFLLPFYPNERSDYCTNIDSFPLGCDFESTKSIPTPATTTHPTLLAAFSQTANEAPVFLMVSTFDPRKNHSYLLDAFEQAWSHGSKAILCCIGRSGWMCDAILERIKIHPERNRRLFVTHDASDADVQFAYQNASVSILPSATEGFGLPIVESLRWGKPTWASDIPIHREVGGEHCCYFDLTKVDSLAEMILQFEAQFSGNSQVAAQVFPTITLTNWKESATIFLQKAIDITSESCSDSKISKLRAG